MRGHGPLSPSDSVVLTRTIALLVFAAAADLAAPTRDWTNVQYPLRRISSNLAVDAGLTDEQLTLVLTMPKGDPGCAAVIARAALVVPRYPIWQRWPWCALDTPGGLLGFTRPFERREWVPGRVPSPADSVPALARRTRRASARLSR